MVREAHLAALAQTAPWPLLLAQIALLMLSGNIDEIYIVGLYGMHLQLVTVLLYHTVHTCAARVTS